MIGSWIPQNVPESAKFGDDSTNFVADSAKLPVLEQFLAIPCFNYFSVEPKTAKNIEKK